MRHRLHGNPVFLALAARKVASASQALSREIRELDALAELAGGKAKADHVQAVELALLTGLELSRMGIGPEAAHAHHHARKLTALLEQTDNGIGLHHPDAYVAIKEALDWLRAQREAATPQQQTRAQVAAEMTAQRLVQMERVERLAHGHPFH